MIRARSCGTPFRAVVTVELRQLRVFEHNEIPMPTSHERVQVEVFVYEDGDILTRTERALSDALRAARKDLVRQINEYGLGYE